MKGFARAMGAATILNAVATWKGSAFGIELQTTAEVELDRSSRIIGDIPGIDDRLVVRCVEMVLEKFGLSYGGVVRTNSEIPVASGLKSSSTAANAAILATLDAIGREMDLIDAAKLGVAAAKEVGVTITGALDDALASMLGGVVVTDNREMKLLKREPLDFDVLLLVPERKLFSRGTDIRRSRLIAPLAEIAFDLAMQGDYGRAMTLNGFIYCNALKMTSEPLLSAMEAGAWGASLSGTGPSYAALIDRPNLTALESTWREVGGRVIRTKVNNKPASIGRGI